MPKLAVIGLLQLLLLCCSYVCQDQGFEFSILENSSQDFEHETERRGLRSLHLKPTRTTSRFALHVASQDKGIAGKRSFSREKPAVKAPIRKHPPLGCSQFSWPTGTQTIAIVGNGPLSKADRAAIEVILVLPLAVTLGDLELQS